MKIWKTQLPIIQERDRTPIVDQLVDLLKEQNKRIDILLDEIKRLKDLKKKPKLKPSKLRDTEKKQTQQTKKTPLKLQQTSQQRNQLIVQKL